jgi:hypothetical protein
MGHAPPPQNNYKSASPKKNVNACKEIMLCYEFDLFIYCKSVKVIKNYILYLYYLLVVFVTFRQLFFLIFTVKLRVIVLLRPKGLTFGLHKVRARPKTIHTTRTIYQSSQSCIPHSVVKEKIATTKKNYC